MCSSYAKNKLDFGKSVYLRGPKWVCHFNDAWSVSLYNRKYLVHSISFRNSHMLTLSSVGVVVKLKTNRWHMAGSSLQVTLWKELYLFHFGGAHNRVRKQGESWTTGTYRSFSLNQVCFWFVWSLLFSMSEAEFLGFPSLQSPLGNLPRNGRVHSDPHPVSVAQPWWSLTCQIHRKMSVTYSSCSLNMLPKS